MATKKSKKSASKRRAGSGTPKPKLRTKFMADFTKEFIHDGKNRIWPVVGQIRPAVVADFTEFARVLFALGYGEPPPLNLSPLGVRIVQFAAPPRDWPNNKEKVPPKYRQRLPTVALVDVAVILDRLLESVNAFELVKNGAGGTPDKWPPH